MKYFLVTILVFANFVLVAQRDVPKKAKQLFQKGKQLVKISQPAAAIPLFEKAIKKHSTYENAYVYLAEALEQNNQLEQAIKTYDKLLEVKPVLKEKITFTKANLYLKYGDYENAIDQLEVYTIMENLKVDQLKKGVDLLKQTKVLIELKKQPVPFNPTSLGSIINTKGLEYLPSLTADEQTIVFTTRVASDIGNEDFYVSNKTNNVWATPVQLKAINTPGDEGAQSISADGKTIFFAASDRLGGLGNFDIWMANKKGDYWDEVQNLGPNINTRFWESQPSISADGKTLYFTSRGRAESIGGYDIYKSDLVNGTWTAAAILDTTINTPKNEQCPFIHHDSQTLYFSSDGHLNFGEEDLFLSELIDGNWSEARNLGYPINTHNSENSLVVSSNGKKAYFSSDRENGIGGLDLYSFDLPEVIKPKRITYFKGIVKDAGNNNPIAANISLFDLLSDEEIYNTSSDESNGSFLATLHADKEYACNVSKEGYLFHSEHFTFKTNPQGKPYILEVFLQPIPTIKSAGEKIVEIEKPKSKVILNNIFFDSGKAELLPASTTELNRLVDLLIEHADLKIQVNGHTDDVGNSAENMKLSENRAKAVVTYLKLKGITGTRLTYKGFGETQPISPETTESGRALNRRTEFEIIR